MERNSGHDRPRPDSPFLLLAAAAMSTGTPAATTQINRVWSRRSRWWALIVAAS